MFKYPLIVTLFLTLMIPSGLFGQVGQIASPNGGSSEWEATGFNNGRRMVRDSNGYFHAFWHSQTTYSVTTPSAINCDIYYSYTTVVAIEPPSMANQNAWVTPINMTSSLGNLDNRYPSAAIEYDVYDGGWQNFNTLHIVWQAITTGSSRYEVLYANIPITNPPTAPAPWGSYQNLSNTTTDSLVPAIAINMYNPDSSQQHIHVVWQEEDVNPGVLGPPAEDAWTSDIAYIRSTDSGLTWSAPAGGWMGYGWDNLTQSTTNSQMPSISCILDQFTGNPSQLGRNELGYNSSAVHVSYNEDIGGGGIHLFYLVSPNDGLNWNPPMDVTLLTGGGGINSDAYSNIAVDMMDNPHFTFMRYNMVPREPMRTGGNQYQPGINPSSWWSFPGPDVGMYGVLANFIVYAYSTSTTGGTWIMAEFLAGDLEFPTVSLDRWQHVNVNWQEFFGVPTSDYEVMRATNLNLIAPTFPLILQNYAGFSAPLSDSKDIGNDDLFPNLAHKKVAMYQSPNEAAIAGYDEIWTKIPGHGPIQAVAPGKQIYQDGNMTWFNPPVPVELSRFEIEE